jgi:hypothetical protein
MVTGASNTVNTRANATNTKTVTVGTTSQALHQESSSVPSRLTNREVLEILEQQASVFQGDHGHLESLQRCISSLKEGPCRVVSGSKEEEAALLEELKGCCGSDTDLKGQWILDALNYLRPKSVQEGESFFAKALEDGNIGQEELERIVAVLKAKRAAKGVDDLEEENE